MKSMQKPLLLILGIIVCLSMMRLGVWQLSRAAEKQLILDQVQAQATLAPIALDKLLAPDIDLIAQRFRKVSLTGQYLATQSVLLDNQVFDTQVGYKIYTPFQLANSQQAVLVDRGWLPVGQSRASLPDFNTFAGQHTISGRLALPPAPPPLWSEQASVASGAVWQFLPLDKVAASLQLELLPMVVELAPASAAEIEPELRRRWQQIDDKWVATHHGYAFQWFSMAAVLFIAGLVLAIRSSRPTKN